MPNTWRPDNWQQEYYYGGSLSCLIHDYGEPNKVFEAGADAMLTSLLKSGMIKVSDLEGSQYGNGKEHTQ
mgnify:CR=1 FL=1